MQLLRVYCVYRKKIPILWVPCIVPRAAIVQTCAAALAVGDLMTARYGTAWMERPTSYRREEL